MKLYASTLPLQAAVPGEPNPLPALRSKSRNKVLSDNGLLESELEGFGDETGFCALPYMMQNSYTRELSEKEFSTVVLENDCLRATFLADFGGRLWSLYDKRAKRELLFKNPVFRTANLAIRNAWFSGGIEWNVGQYGHTCLTCEPMFFAKCTDENGGTFLRMYEYERQKCLFLQIDFHLPDGAEYLAAHVRIMNSKAQHSPLYWWTNIAVEENRGARVLSGTKEVIYICPETQKTQSSTHGFAHGEMPFLKTLGGQDASYPKNLPYSNEYFFQNPKDISRTWEAVAYDDGTAFWERSTDTLRYRKMFCWGNHPGGTHWKRFLSDDVNGDYLEIQSGLAPTQVHGAALGAGEALSFTQVFGGCDVNNDLTNTQWVDACGYMYDRVENKLSAKHLAELDAAYEKLCDKAPDEIIHGGNGWGALELLRDNKIIPRGMIFPVSTLGDRQKPWVELLINGAMPELSEDEMPASWMTDSRWMSILEKTFENKKNQSSTAYLHYGIMLIENDFWKEGVVALQRSITLRPTALAHRCMAQALEKLDRGKEACEEIEAALERGIHVKHKAFAEEYITLHGAEGQWEKAWEFFNKLPEEEKNDERIRLRIAEAAFELGETDFLEKLFAEIFAAIREGESVLLELWFKRRAQEIAAEQEILDYRDILAEVTATLTPPYNLDFRQTP